MTNIGALQATILILVNHIIVLMIYVSIPQVMTDLSVAVIRFGTEVSLVLILHISCILHMIKNGTRMLLALGLERLQNPNRKLTRTCSWDFRICPFERSKEQKLSDGYWGER